MKRIILLSAVLLVAACDLAEESFTPQVVVDGILMSGEPMPSIWIGQSFPLTSAIPPDRGAIRNAVVRVERLAPDGSVAEAIDYVEGNGAYLPSVTTPVVPLSRYRLRVEVPEHLGLVRPGEVVTAETVVPDTFRVVTPPPDTVAYRPLGPSPELTVTTSAYPGRNAIYLFSIRALQPEKGLTPTYAELVDPEDAVRLIDGTSPLLNEEGYGVNPDGTITLQIPWLAIAYYGQNAFIAQALDDAAYDFIRSRDAQFGGATLSPGEIPEVLSNVRNGAGLFGSAARQGVLIYIAP